MHTPNRRSTTTETVFSHKSTKQVCVFLKHQIYSQKKWWVKTSKDDSSILNSRIILFGREQQYIGDAWIYMLLSHIGAIKNTTLKINIIQSCDSSEMRNLSFWIAPVNAELYCFFWTNNHLHGCTSAITDRYGLSTENKWYHGTKFHHMSKLEI